MELLGVNPGRKIAGYFLSAILVGAVLLLLPVSAAREPIGLVNALFTATSAVCVTGLTVLDTGQDFSTFGQVVIMLLFQLGGLGIMTIATSLLLSFSSGLSFKDKSGLSQSLGTGVSIDHRSLLKAVFITTISIELVGALALFGRFSNDFPAPTAAFYAVFHAISAFCNAGFSTFSNSLEGYRNDLWIIATFSALIILGGLGFAVIRELALTVGQKRTRLSLHSKLCLATTLILLVAGTVLFFVAERTNVFAGGSFLTNLANAFFQAVTCRTAGFNTLPQAGFTELTVLVTLILMFIGACPGSTGGGIKTTTFAIIILLLVRRFTGCRSVAAFKRTISNDSIIRAVAVVLLAILVVIVVFGLFISAEERPLSHRLSHDWFVEYLFEIVSAFGTVGLSMGVTSHLHDTGKILLMFLMFTGRVGLLTFAFALARIARRGEIVYLEEDIMVG